jgi:hypothetical protein
MKLHFFLTTIALLWSQISTANPTSTNHSTPSSHTIQHPLIGTENHSTHPLTKYIYSRHTKNPKNPKNSKPQQSKAQSPSPLAWHPVQSFNAQIFRAQNETRPKAKSLTRAEAKIVGDPIMRKPALYYYNLYKKDRLKVETKDGQKIPTNADYTAEVELRKKHYSLLARISKLKEKFVFDKNDAGHTLMKLGNQRLELKNVLFMLRERAAERLTSLQFGIDHDWAWKNFYELKNKANLEKSAKAQMVKRDSFEKMARFDASRSKSFQKKAEGHYQALLGLESVGHKSSSAL